MSRVHSERVSEEGNTGRAFEGGVAWDGLSSPQGSEEEVRDSGSSSVDTEARRE